MPRGGSNYIPRPDGDFDAFIQNYVNAVSVWWLVHKLDVGGLTALTDAQQTWNTRYAKHVAAQSAAEGARQAKDLARVALEQAVRPMTNFIQAFPETTEADRAMMGITVRGNVRTPTAAPTTRPAARVVSGQRLTHTLRFSDEATPTRRGKPRGTLGAEVWLAIAPTGEQAPPLGDGYTFLGLNSRGSLQADFPSSEAGKTAYYALRWVSTRGEKGPWSEVAAATVAA